MTGCTNSPVIGPERGIVFGTVRSAADGRPLQDALVRVAWTDVSAVSAERLGAAEASVEARTDSLGLYRVCGVPPEVVVTAQAAGPTARTGVAETQLGPLGVARVNLELAEGDAGQAAAPGAVHGTVADSAGRPVADALVLLDGATVQARTDSAGAFRLAGVPAGTQSLEVRQVGLAPARRSVSVPPGDTARVSLVLARSQLLDAVVVTAASGRLAPKVADAVRRHQAGFGQLYLEEEIARAATLPTLFQHVPGVRLAQARLGVGGDWVVLMRNHVGSQCPARIFVDERETDGEELMSISKDDVVAVEVFVRPTTAPIFTSGRSRFSSDMCGVIVVWTRGAR